jgi:hypothetical protein
MAAIPAEFFFFVGLLDFRRFHGLRKVSARASPSSGEAWPRFCVSALLSSTNRLLRCCG